MAWMNNCTTLLYMDVNTYPCSNPDAGLVNIC